MATLVKQYQTVFQDMMFQENFKKSGRGFYRLCDDVLQILYMRSYQGETDFCYTTYPLSLGARELYLEGIGVSYFRKGGHWWWWPNQELMDTNFAEPYALVKEHAMPFFQKGIDSKSAYQARIDRYYEIYSHEPPLNDWVSTLFCLQLGDYARAEIHMAAIIDQNILSLATFSNDIDLSSERCTRIVDNIMLLKRIHERDTEYWNNELDRDRKKTLDFLASLEPKRRKKTDEV